MKRISAASVFLLSIGIGVGVPIGWLLDSLQGDPLRTEGPAPAVSQPKPIHHPARWPWCPNAACNNSPLCRPCDQRFLFIISARSAASTTLLAMMNLLPNVSLSGENANELYVASKSESNLLKPDRIIIRRDGAAFNPPEGAWMRNEVPGQAMACPIQKVMTTIAPPPSEVASRLGRPGAPTLDEYVTSTIVGAAMTTIQTGEWWAGEAAKFFHWNFPCAKYLVNVRPGNVEANFLLRFADKLGGDRARVVKMEDWTRNVTVLNEAVSWMGFSDCHFENVPYVHPASLMGECHLS